MELKGRAALFLDRDGVINDDVGYTYLPEEDSFPTWYLCSYKSGQCPRYACYCRNKSGGIARGFYEEKDFHVLMDWMQKRFRESGAHIYVIYFFPITLLMGKVATR